MEAVNNMNGYMGQEEIYSTATLLIIAADKPVSINQIQSSRVSLLGRPTRDNHPDVAIESKICGRRHAQISCVDGQWIYNDLGSINGSYINGKLYKSLPGMAPENIALNNGDVIRIDTTDLEHPDVDNGVWILFTIDQNRGGWYQWNLTHDDHVTIGRVSDNAICLKSAYITRHHAEIAWNGKNYVLTDLKSTAGTWYNGKQIAEPVVLKNRDTFFIFDRIFVFLNDKLFYSNYETNTAASREEAAASNSVSLNKSVAITGQALIDEQTMMLRKQQAAATSAPSVASAPAAPAVAPTPAVAPNSAPAYNPAAQPARQLVPPVAPMAPIPGQPATPGYPVPGYPASAPAYQAPMQSAPAQQHNYFIQADIRSKKVKSNTGGGEIELLRDIRVNIEEGTMVALLGTAGAGKSTFMDILNGTQVSGVTGRVVLGGQDLIANAERLKHTIGIVGQQEVFNPSFNVETEILFAAQKLLTDYTGKEQKAAVYDLIEKFGMTPKRKSIIARCSGGEKRRVHIMASMISDRRVFFMDEPDAGLDPGNKKNMFAILRDMAHDPENPKTIMVIIHDVSELDMFDQVIMLRKFNNVGRLAFSGSPAQAKQYFGITRYQEMYDRINQDTDGSKYLKGGI